MYYIYIRRSPLSTLSKTEADDQRGPQETEGDVCA